MALYASSTALGGRIHRRFAFLGRSAGVQVTQRTQTIHRPRTQPLSMYFDSRASVLPRYFKRKTNPITLQQMIAMTKPKALRNTADFLGEELKVRIAHRIRDLQRLPPSLSTTSSVSRVVAMYKEFFEELCAMPTVQTSEEHEEFCRVLKSIKERDSRTLPAMAYGLKEWKLRNTSSNVDPIHDGLVLGSGDVDQDVSRNLDRMFTARLSVRMLIGQHVEAYENGGMGRINRKLRVVDVAKEAVDSASKMCLDRYGVVPSVEFYEANGAVKMTYVKSHLHHIIFELVKNSMRAVVEQHNGAEGERRRRILSLPKSLREAQAQHGPKVLPSIQIVVSGGEEDVTVKVSDMGGGVPRSDMHKIWSYQYTTAPKTPALPQHGEFDQRMDMAYQTFRDSFFGLGYGLPISRVFARYFGGDLTLYCTEGWGTDAYVHLPKLESAAKEQIAVVLPN